MKIEERIANAGSLPGVEPMTDSERAIVRELVGVWRGKLSNNRKRERYYLEHVTPRSLGISVPPKVRVNAACGWPRKAVDYIASRSQFDGYTTSDEEAAGQLRGVVADNDMKNAYNMAVTSELMHCCTMLSVSAGDQGEPPVLVSMTPATASSGIWDDRARQIEAGLAVVKCDRRNGRTQPVWVDVFLGDTVLTLKDLGTWTLVDRQVHGMGRSLMEPLANCPTLMRPFGSSVITHSVMLLADNYMREAVRSEVAAEFAASPQKYLLGADQKVVEGMSKYDAYIGSILAVSRGNSTVVPQFGQLPQPSMQPHIDYNRSLAAQFSGETNVPLSALGVVSDNPSSAEAIYATKEDAVIQVQRLNAANARSLVNVGYMALAILNGTDFATEKARVPDLAARFRNPAMPSIVSQSDAMVKQISAIPWLAESDVALEQLGYDDEQIQRLNSDKRRAGADAAMQALFSEQAAAGDEGSE